MFFTLNRCTLQLNMHSRFAHVFHAEPLHTSAQHAQSVDVVTCEAPRAFDRAVQCAVRYIQPMMC